MVQETYPLPDPPPAPSERPAPRIDKFERFARERGDFLTHLSQAGRTYLSLIKGPLERALDHDFGRVAPALREQLLLMNRNTTRLTRLVDQLVEIIDLENGRVRLDVRCQDLVAFVRERVEQFQRPAMWKRVDLRFETARPHLPLFFCAEALGRAVSNLLALLLQRTPEGGALRVSVEPDDLYPATHATLTLRASGGFCPDEVAPLLDCFEAYDTGDDAVQQYLGSTIAHRLVRLHGGHLDAACAPDGALAFRLRLPKGLAHLSHPADDRPAAGAGDTRALFELLEPFEALMRREGSGPDAAVPDQAILLVEQMPDMRAYLRSCLEPHYRVLEAADGATALLRIGRDSPDLIVCNLGVPGLGGLELLHAVKSNPAFAAIPFILVTARASDELKVQTLRAGAVDYLVQPFRAAELLAKIDTLLQIGERERQARMLAQQAQLQMLRYQLNPHFLFNALNTIRALVLADAPRARHMVTELSEYLRYSLLTANALETSLREEEISVRSYLSIEKIRFEDDLQVAFELDPAAADCVVPSLLLQPLVENAVKYGMRTSARPLHIRLRGTLQHGRLRLEVANTGAWLPPAKPGARGTGIGLSNLRQRLEHRFPGRHHFETFEEAGWVKAVVTLQL